MSRIASMLFAIVAYAIFFATFLYLVVFVGDLSLAKVTVDVGPQAPPVVAAVVDVALIALFGLQQAWFHFRGREAPPPKFHQPLFYKWVRHPLYFGFFLAFWAAPEMTAGHLLLAIGMSVYMLIAIRYEEHDLIGLFGKDYEQYREEVGMLTPRFRRRSS